LQERPIEENNKRNRLEEERERKERKKENYCCKTQSAGSKGEAGLISCRKFLEELERGKKNSERLRADFEKPVFFEFWIMRGGDLSQVRGVTLAQQCSRKRKGGYGKKEEERDIMGKKRRQPS